MSDQKQHADKQAQQGEQNRKPGEKDDQNRTGTIPAGKTAQEKGGQQQEKGKDQPAQR